MQEIKMSFKSITYSQAAIRNKDISKDAPLKTKSFFVPCN
jgi:hypothetical protein